MIRPENKGLEVGWMFPVHRGNAADAELARSGMVEVSQARKDHEAVHGPRYTFTDLVRRANVDAVVRRALTGHVTEEMQRHYSTVGLDEKRAATATAGCSAWCRQSGLAWTKAGSRLAVGPEVGPRWSHL